MREAQMWDWKTLPFSVNTQEWRTKELPMTGPVKIQHGITGRRTSDSMHTHADDHVVYTFRGSARGLCGDQSVHLTPGTVLHIPAGVKHSITFEAAWEGLQICLGQPAAMGAAIVTGALRPF